MTIDINEFRKYTFDSERVAIELAKSLKLPYFNLQVVKPEIDALKFVNEELAEKVKAIPIKKERNVLIIGIVDPYNPNLSNLKESLERQGLEIKLGIISPESFEIGKKEYRFLQEKGISYVKIFELSKEVIQKVKEEIKSKEDFRNFALKLIQSNPFLLLDCIIAGALTFNASDIHIEPSGSKVSIRYRLDGILYDIFDFSKDIYEILKNKIKVLSGLFINITDKPQDGSFSIVFDNENVDFRVATIPAGDNEAIVLRVLRFSQLKTKLEELGLRDDDREILERNISQTNGLILNTGPTGSGKTTTLYAILLKIKSPNIKIITIENPIEYKIEGISQSQVDEARGFTFASALRSILRHDPDVILVGEIRDKETADTAIQASLTGHLVLSTLHTNDSLGAIPRLISLGVDPKLIPPALRLVIAQRLVRKICEFCKEEYTPETELKNKIKEKLKNLPPRVKEKFDLENFVLARGKGCSNCFGTGYKGRIGIFELLEVTKDLEELIYQRPGESEILKAISKNFVTLQQDALIKALLKITTIQEVERVTGSL